MFNKKSLIFLFAKRQKSRSPKIAAGVKHISIKRSIPEFSYKTEASLRERRLIMKRFITARILIMIKEFLLKEVREKSVFHKKRPAAKSIREQKKYIRLIVDSSLI